MVQHHLHKAADAFEIKNERCNTDGEQPKGHTIAEDDAQQGNVQDLKIHLIGIDSGTQEKADLYRKEQEGVEAEQQEDAHHKLPGEYEYGNELIVAARFGGRVITQD